MSGIAKIGFEVAREIGDKAQEDLHPTGRETPIAATLAETAREDGWDAGALMNAADETLIPNILPDIAPAGLGLDVEAVGWSDVAYGECSVYEHTWDSECFSGAGDPTGEAQFWRLQNGPSCAVNAQICVVESITGECLDEAEVCAWLEENGYYDPWGGTPLEHMDKLLDRQGIETSSKTGAEVTDIADALERGDRVIVALNAQEIWEPLRDADTGQVVPQPGPYGHAVQITGIDQQDDGSFSVIMNDTGREDGAMRAVTLEDFLEAWNDYDNHMIVARSERPAVS